MSEQNYTIRRDEWEKVVDTLQDIKSAIIRLEERENARDDRVAASQATAEKALQLATDNATRITKLEASTGTNTKMLDNWQATALRLIGYLTGAGIVGAAGFFLGGVGP